MLALKRALVIAAAVGRALQDGCELLEIEFPQGIQMMFDFLSLLAINLKSILQIDCLGDLTFCTFLLLL